MGWVGVRRVGGAGPASGGWRLGAEQGGVAAHARHDGGAVKVVAGQAGVGAVGAADEAAFGEPGGEFGHQLGGQGGELGPAFAVQAHADGHGDGHPAPRGVDPHGQHHQVEAAGVHDVVAGGAHGVAEAARPFTLRPGRWNKVSSR